MLPMGCRLIVPIVYRSGVRRPAPSTASRSPSPMLRTGEENVYSLKAKVPQALEASAKAVNSKSWMV